MSPIARLDFAIVIRAQRHEMLDDLAPYGHEIAAQRLDVLSRTDALGEGFERTLYR